MSRPTRLALAALLLAAGGCGAADRAREYAARARFHDLTKYAMRFVGAAAARDTALLGAITEGGQPVAWALAMGARGDSLYATAGSLRIAGGWRRGDTATVTYVARVPGCADGARLRLAFLRRDGAEPLVARAGVDRC